MSRLILSAYVEAYIMCVHIFVDLYRKPTALSSRVRLG